jgi:TonB family protein
MKELLLIAAFLTEAVGQLPNQMGIVTGRLMKNGQPAANIRVSAMAIPEAGVSITEVSSLASVVLTDSDGRYRLENIPPGRYYVTAGFLDVPTYYPGVASIGSAKAVSVEPGVTTTGIDFTTAVSAGATVSGRVIYPPGQSVPLNQKVSLVGSQRPAPESFVKPDGSFEVQRVRPGNYTLRVPPLATTVIVGDADISGVEIEVPYNVAGTVVVENGGPLPSLSLSFTSTKVGAEPQNMTLSAAGAFSSQLTPGDYRLAVSGIPTGYSLKSVTVGTLDLLTNPLKVVAGTPPAPINVMLGVAAPPPWVKVSGKVGGPGLMGVTPYPLTLTGKGLLAPMQSSLMPDGSFEFPRVLPGDYTLAVGVPAARKIPIQVGSTNLSGIDIAIPVMKDVTARVTIEGPQQGGVTITQQANGAVYIMTGPPASLELSLADQLGATSTTATRQADGTFRLRLPEGERAVTAEVAGYTVKSLSYGSTDLLKDSPLKVSSADTAQVEMTLVPSAQGSVEGRVFSSVSTALANVANSLNAVRFYFSTAAGAAGAAGGVIYTFAGSPAVTANTPVHVGPDVAHANLLSSVPSAYPAAAPGVQDPVVLRAEINKEGTVTDVSVVSGNPLLNDAAIAAVKQWRYRPHLLNGQPTAIVTTINLGK